MAEMKSKKFLFIITGIFMGVMLLASLLLFNFVSPYAAGIAFNIIQPAAFAAAGILAFVTSAHYKNLSRLSGETGGRDKNIGFYFKRILISVVLIILMSMAISEGVGMILNGIVGGTRIKMIDSGSFFMSGFIIKGPLFAIYLLLIYNMFSQQGYRDANGKIFNAHLKIIIIAVAFIIMMPSAVMNSMHYTQYVPENIGGADIQAVFSANINVYVEDIITDLPAVNPDFNIILTAFTVLLAFIAQAAVVIFAYNHGKQTFLKKRLNPAEVETDEKF